MVSQGVYNPRVGFLLTYCVQNSKWRRDGIGRGGWWGPGEARPSKQARRGAGWLGSSSRAVNASQLGPRHLEQSSPSGLSLHPVLFPSAVVILVPTLGALVARLFPKLSVFLQGWAPACTVTLSL